MEGGEWDALIHLAANVSVIESFTKPNQYFANNTLGLIPLLHNNKFARVVFASTGGAMYGNRHLAKEDDAMWENCASPYAQSKYLAEQIVSQHESSITLRLANVYGGDYSVRGEAAVHAHFEGDTPIVVYGGKQTRDFIHVSTVCKVIQRAAESKHTGTYNIGSGVETNIAKLAEPFAERRGVAIQYLPKRAGEVEYISLDTTSAIENELLQY